MIKKIAEEFIGKSDFFKAKEISGGNINKSYLINSNSGKYILQRINTAVFSDPQVLMQNILSVCEHLKMKKISTLTFIKRIGSSGENVDSYLVHCENEFWRCMLYIENSGQSVSLSNCELAKLTGHAFGEFIKNCADIQTTLSPTIPNFHNLPDRIQTLNNIYNENKHLLRFKKADLVYKNITSLLEKVKCRLRDDLPDRITHNDTKMANLLFNGDRITVIDLDTVMVGKVTDDFGDAARSVASSACEDEIDITKIYFDIDKFSAFSSGFLNGTQNLLTEDEIMALSYAPAYVTAELACRFLADYYNGNKYFNTFYPEHNLDRAINQTVLLDDMLDKQGKIENIIKTEYMSLIVN